VAAAIERLDGVGSRAARMTTQGWLYLVLAVAVVLAAIATGVGAAMLHRTNDVTDHLVKRIDPAQAAAYQLQATLVDQETGVRGYALAADRQFLAPYLQGQKSEAASASTIRRLLSEDAQELEDLQRVEAAAANWRRDYADPLIKSVIPGEPRAVNRSAAAQGKKAFDQVRSLFAVQNAHLAQARATSFSDLRRVRAQRNWVFSLMAVGFVVLALLTILLTRRLVIRPLDMLRSSSRRVASGDFEHAISENGPADLQAVARDVDVMRQQILAELNSSREQERQLAEQAADLDAQAVDLRRSNAELEQFAYVASHDLQEPLRKVASFCQLLEKRYGESLDERGRQYIDFAVDGAKRMQVLITDLLTFSRVGRVSETQQSASIAAALDQALANLTNAIGESQARVERPEQLPVIAGDPTLLVMLWQNLVGNAIKFHAPDRAPVVSIRCESTDDDGHREWLVSVSDNGIGIPAEFAEKVFVIFQRLHNREAYGGTGIGLALCKKIVEYHGGRIWLDTTYAEGTRICFTLPADTPAGHEVTSNRTALEGSKA